jgi:hypothetical protein
MQDSEGRFTILEIVGTCRHLTWTGSCMFACGPFIRIHDDTVLDTPLVSTPNPTATGLVLRISVACIC